MYSGNHSLVHPLETLLNCAYNLRTENDFLFVFIGDGVRKSDVTKFKKKYGLKNIIQLPYQDRSIIHLSLGSADLQVVIMGENQVGFTHPNKIYGALFLEKPIVYIGPKPSHIDDIFEFCPGNISVNHGESEQLAKELLKFHSMDESKHHKIGRSNKAYAERNLSSNILLDKMVKSIEGN